MNWFAVTHRNGVARVFVHAEIGTWGIGFDEFARELGDAQTVELRIASPGGDSGCALKIAQLLGERDTVATFTGPSCSSAITLALGAERILAHSDARLMVHSPVSFVAGSPKELRSEADSLEKLIAPITELYGRRCSPALVREWFAGDHWLSATEALTCGLVDEVVSPATLPDRAVAPVATITTSAPVGPTPEEAFVLDLLRIAGPIRVVNRERFARELSVWFSTVKEL